ncbi:hypothetical protein, partial [Streptomyces sp. NPDC088135]|uniref:hypothetical protein n=1 Tax=Streptomyces sp. NPDC088135 TaxID=3160993 RepID=UPI003441B8F6
GIVFRDGASDHGLHTLGVVLVAAGLAVLLLTVLDRRLMGRGTDRRTGTADTVDSTEDLGAVPREATLETPRENRAGENPV